VHLDDLDYELPEELIAQRPAARREDARLLVVERATRTLHDQRIRDLPSWLRRGDALALNETRVRQARLRLRRPSGGAVEVLLVRPDADDLWRALVKPARRARTGGRLISEDRSLELVIEEAVEGGERRVRVARGDLEAAMRAQGETPLPPYIRRSPDDEDRERYQTVYARIEGAVAAPTAGLHFSEALLEALAHHEVERVPILLHVGPGTFRPITASDPREHVMDEEWYDVSDDAARRLRHARSVGGRIVAVGTTVVRALESACDEHGGELGPARGWTRKFIVPPYRFRAIDVLLTNFHLPRTTLLLLVAAFAGDELLRRAYAHAVAERYRFYSYGDAMLVT
jgi:S-adenosylmethionine:tRNA ribosyltransferase-isomerase